MRPPPFVLVLSVLCLLAASPTAAAGEPCPWLEIKTNEMPPYELHPECLGGPLRPAWVLVEELLP